LSPQLQALDPVYLADIFDAGGEPLLRDVVETFLADVPRRLRAMQERLAAADWDGAALAAHAMVSGSSMLGLMAVAAAARRNEQVLYERRPPPRPDLDALEAAVAEARGVLAMAVSGLVTGSRRAP
jgi:HPt (histidine-containing phosphotransfer) domain-containing protein